MKKFFSLSSLRKSTESDDHQPSPNSNLSGSRIKRLSTGSLSSRQSISIEVIRDGYNVDLSRVDSSFSKLHRDCLLNRPLKKLHKHLRRYRAQLNQIDNVAGCAPLHLSIVNAASGHVQALLAGGAQIELPDGQGKTPLIKAIQCAPELITMLLESGADPNQSDTRLRNSPLHWAAMQNRPDSFAMLLLSGQLNVRQLNASGQSALHVLASNNSRHWRSTGQAEMNGLVSTLGFNGNDSRLADPLHRFAVQLIARGCPLDQQDELGATALHLAASSGQLDMVGALLDSNANTQLMNKSGQTPLQLAEHLGQQCIVMLLRSRPVQATFEPKNSSFTPSRPESMLSQNDSNWSDSESDNQFGDHSPPRLSALLRSAPSNEFIGRPNLIASNRLATKRASLSTVTSQSDEFDSSNDQQHNQSNHENTITNLNGSSPLTSNLTASKTFSIANPTKSLSPVSSSVTASAPNDAFIRQMRQLIEEEIDLNEDLDQMLIGTATGNTKQTLPLKSSEKSPTESSKSEVKGTLSKANAAYMFDSDADEDEEFDREMAIKAFGPAAGAISSLAIGSDSAIQLSLQPKVAEPTEATMDAIDKKHIVYGLSDDEPDDLEERRLLSAQSWFSNEKQSPLFQNHLEHSSQDNKDANVSREAETSASSHHLSSVITATNTSNNVITEIDQLHHQATLTINKEINQKLRGLSQLHSQDDTSMSNFIIDVPKSSENHLKSNGNLCVRDEIEHPSSKTTAENPIVQSDPAKSLTETKEDSTDSSDLLEQRLFVKDQQIELLRKNTELQTIQAKQLEQKCMQLDEKCRLAIDRTEDLQSELLQTSATLEAQNKENSRLRAQLESQQKIEINLKNQCNELQSQIEIQNQQVHQLSSRLARSQDDMEQHKRQSQQFLLELQHERDKFIEFIRNEQKQSERQLKLALTEKQTLIEQLQQQLSDTKLQLMQISESDEFTGGTEQQLQAIEDLKEENLSLRRQLNEVQHRLQHLSIDRLSQGENDFRERQQQNQQLMDSLHKLAYVVERMEEQISSRLQENSLLDSDLVTSIENLIVNSVRTLLASTIDQKLDSINRFVAQFSTKSVEIDSKENDADKTVNDKRHDLLINGQSSTKSFDPSATNEIKADAFQQQMQHLHQNFEQFLDQMQDSVRDQVQSLTNPRQPIDSVYATLSGSVPVTYATQYSNALLRLSSSINHQIEPLIPREPMSSNHATHNYSKMVNVHRRPSPPLKSIHLSNRSMMMTARSESELHWVNNFHSVNRSLDRKISNLKSDLGICSPVN